MNSAVKQNPDKPAQSKGTQEVNATSNKDRTMLDRINEARREGGGGVKMLPVVRYEGKLWFLDERLRQLRNVGSPHDFIDLNDFEVEYFMRTEG